MLYFTMYEYIMNEKECPFMSKSSFRSKRSSIAGARFPLGGVIALVIVVALVVSAGFIFIPRLTHHCDNCGEFFWGTGYRANVLTNTLTGLAGNADKTLCLDCAIREHALEIVAGSSISDFELPLFDFLEDQTAAEGE